MIAKLTDLEPDLQNAIGGHDLIVFDGECVLCSGFFRFVLVRDRGQRFQFVLAQSELGARIYTALGLDTRDFETNIVVTDGSIYAKLNAFAAAMRTLGWPWRILSVAAYLPRPIADPIYHLIARSRYRIFGRYDACMLPGAALQSRFLDGGGLAR